MAVIEERATRGGQKTYRVKIRLKGFAFVTASFSRKTDAKEWARAMEAAIKDGRYFKAAEAKKHAASELITRYLKGILPRKPKPAWDQTQHLNWWKEQLGHLTLADLAPAVIIEMRSKLASEDVPGGEEAKSGNDKPLHGCALLCADRCNNQVEMARCYIPNYLTVRVLN